MAQKLLKSLSTVSGMTLISRVLGFVRDMVVALVFGATPEADAFYIAFKIPNFMRRLFAEGAFSQAFVPMLSHCRAQQSQAEVMQFINRIVGNLGAVLLIVTVLGIVGAPWLTFIFAPGFYHDAARFSLTNDMLRILFPYIFFISLTACFGGILNTYHKFAVPAFTPVLLNIVMIAAALWLSPLCDTPIMALAWGVLIAGIVQCVFQLPFLSSMHLLPKPQIAFRDDAVKTLLKRMVPALFGVSIAQINLLVDTLFASFLKVGSVTWLYYSDRLMSLPLGVFGVAVATVVLPHLSRHHATSDKTQYANTVTWALKILLLIGVPASLALMILAGPLFATLFQYGKFGEHDVLMAAQSLMAYSVGLQFFMLIKIFAAGFYASGNVGTPARFAAVAMVLNIVFIAVLIVPLQHAGIALATSLSAIVNTGLLGFGLYRLGLWVPDAAFKRFLGRLTLANGVLGVCLWFARGDLSWWFEHRFAERLEWLGLIIAVAVSVYVGSLLISGLRGRELHL